MTDIDLIAPSDVMQRTAQRFEKTGEVQFNHLLRIALVLGRLDDFKTLFAPEDIPTSLYDFKVEKVRQRARKK